MFTPQQTALLFPGQGSQTVGMGRAFYDHPHTNPLFEKANEVLGYDLVDIMLNGPEEKLTLTENAQPAILLTSIVAWEYFKHKAELPVADIAAYAAGHSLGEYSALVAAGALSFEDAIALVHTRGKAMQQAVPPGEGAMAAVLGLTFTDNDSVARNTGCWIANDNAEGQCVLSGSHQAVDEASNMAVMQDAKKVMRLDVSAPFHCPMMEPAAKVMEDALKNIEIHEPAIPVVMNRTAQPVSKPDDIRTLLVEQITGMVRWRESMQGLASIGVTTMFELGEGRVLSGLARRCAKSLKSTPLNSPLDIDNLLEALKNNQEVA